MGTARQSSSDYRDAFAEFARKARQARALMSAANPDWQAIDTALLDLEKARVNYNRCRDLLTEELLSVGPQGELASDSIYNRIREVAELRWELAGKPEGTDDENWYRAEDIVRRSTAA